MECRMAMLRALTSDNALLGVAVCALEGLDDVVQTIELKSTKTRVEKGFGQEADCSDCGLG